MDSDVPTWHPFWSSGADLDPFRIVVCRPAGSLAVVEVIGELDIATCPEFDTRLHEELHGSRVSDVILDFTRLELLSARGVRGLLCADAAARAKRIRLQIVTSNSVVLRVLTLFDIDARLCVQPDMATARAAIGQLD